MKLFSEPMGNCTGTTVRPKAVVSDSITRLKSARSRSMRVQTMTRGSANLSAVVPDALGDDLHAADRVDHHQRGFHGGQRHLGFVDEHVEAGSVDQVDLGLAPLDDGGGGGDGHRPRDFFFVVIGDGGAFIDPAQALGGAGGEQHGRGEGGFAGVGVPDQGDVADVCAFVILHL